MKAELKTVCVDSHKESQLGLCLHFSVVLNDYTLPLLIATSRHPEPVGFCSIYKVYMYLCVCITFRSEGNISTLTQASCREANRNAPLSLATKKAVCAECTQCPFTFTLGLCSANIVRFLSCMLIQWPWQCADRSAETEEGQQEGGQAKYSWHAPMPT